MKQRTCLALSPHTDDAEFGAGATIARLVAEDWRVVVVAFSACGDGALRDEFAASIDVLGCEGQIVADEFTVREFAAERQRVLDTLIGLREEFAPDLVLCPSRADTHQDHAVVAAETVRAFKATTVLGYVLPWNCPSVTLSTWQRVYDADVARKLAAVACYESQRGRAYASEDAVRAQLTTAGVQAGCRFAEAFETIRCIR